MVSRDSAGVEDASLKKERNDGDGAAQIRTSVKSAQVRIAAKAIKRRSLRRAARCNVGVNNRIVGKDTRGGGVVGRRRRRKSQGSASVASAKRAQGFCIASRLIVVVASNEIRNAAKKIRSDNLLYRSGFLRQALNVERRKVKRRLELRDYFKPDAAFIRLKTSLL